MSWLARKMHRLHRSFGTALFALLAVWFASGAVMTVAPFPRFSEEERLETARALPRDVEVPAEVVQAVTRGEHAQLSNVEGRAVWITARGATGLKELDEARARREIEARFGTVAWIERLDQLDQWSVPGRQLPLYRAGFASGDQAYLAAKTGQIVQYTSSRERTLAWFGAIAHWLYFPWLRAQRPLWRYAVLTLATLGMFVTLSGLGAGISVARRQRRTLRNPLLRWHQRLGLGFGALAFTWLFSGALSLTPFQWSHVEPPKELFRAGVEPTTERVKAALQACDMEVRELELAPLAGHTFAVCASGRDTRIGDLADGQMRSLLPPNVLPGSTLEHAPDTYFYPQHDRPFPHAYLRQVDGARTLYIDAARARLLDLHTWRTRLERWLYHGLHSLDVPGLYERTWLWRATIWLAMIMGFALSLLGAALAWRRLRPRSRHAQALLGAARADQNR